MTAIFAAISVYISFRDWNERYLLSSREYYSFSGFFYRKFRFFLSSINIIQKLNWSSNTLFFFSAQSDIATFALLKDHYTAKHPFDTNLFAPESRPIALKALYDAATKTPVHLMRQLDRWRRDGHRSSRFFLCTPVLGRRKIKSKVDIEIETRMVS